MSNNRMRNVLCYQCKTELYNEDSCFLVSRNRYDEDGRLIEVDNGGDKGKDFSMNISYRKCSDFLYESITGYSLLDNVIPNDFYFDTIIRGKSERGYLYKKDRNNKLYVKSLYQLDSNGDLTSIGRYDLDNKLIHIYYPFGNRKPVQQSKETRKSEFDSVITVKSVYEENEVASEYVYNNKGYICEITEVNNTYSSKRKSVIKNVYSMIP